MARWEAFQSSNASLRELSIENRAFQEWGKTFMLRVANEHLSKVPLFGLEKGILTPQDVNVRAILTLTGAEIDLCTVDGKHAMYYERGVLYKAVAHDEEMASIFYGAASPDRWTNTVEPWTEEQARKAAKDLVEAKGLDLKRIGARCAPVVRPATFNLPTQDGTVKPVTMFCEVAWPDANLKDSDVLRIEFRRTKSGRWEPTVWFNGSTETSDTESTNFTNLFKRFFTGTVRSD